MRERVVSDLSAFLVAFEALCDDDTPHSRALVLDATDRLLRLGARTRIELERLEHLAQSWGTKARRYGA